MRRTLTAAGVAVLVAAAPLWAAAPARVQVTAREFSLSLSRQTLRAGPAVVELVNFGEDAHDLRLRRAGGRRTYAIPVTGAGGVRRLRVTLAAGRYALWCSVGDHRARGMEASLRVVRR